MRLSLAFLLLLLGASEPQTTGVGAGSPQVVQWAALPPRTTSQPIEIKVKPYDPIILAPDGDTVGAVLYLDIFPEDVVGYDAIPALADKDGKPLQQARFNLWAKPGSYTAKIRTIRQSANGLTGTEQRYRIIVGEPDKPDKPDDRPDDKPPSFPDGKYKLADFAYKAASMLTDPNRKANAQALAASWKSVARRAGAENAFGTVDQMIAATKTANQSAIGGSVSTWAPWKQAIEGRLTELNKAGSLATVADHVIAWNEIATGLEGVTK